MVDKTTSSNVNVNLNPQGFEQAARSVRREITAINKQIESLGKTANLQVRNLGQSLKAINTLRTISPAGQARSDAGFGRQLRQFREMQDAARGTGKTVDLLRGRVMKLDQEIGRSGRTATRTEARRVKALTESAKQYTKLGNSITDTKRRVAGLGKESQQALKPLLADLQRSEARIRKIAANPRRFSFGAELTNTQATNKALREAVLIAEKKERATRRNIIAIREEAKAIAATTEQQRTAEIAKAGRQRLTQVRDENLTGRLAASRRLEGSTKRADQITRSYTRSVNMLNVELAKPVEQQKAGRLQVLINRYRVLTREAGRAAVAQAAENLTPTARRGGVGGFFDGVRSAPGNVFGDEEGSTGSFGAGALVGRVASYAIAASAIYGVISAMRQAASFAVSYEDSLAQLQAISGSTATEMERLSESILAVSQNSINSVSELTKSATVIAQAGFAGSEIDGILKATVNLSAASGSTTDESVDILTSALGAFRLSAGEADRVVNTLVTTLNDSKLSVAQVRLGLQFLGNTASQNNITFEELTATLGAMADAGIRSGSTIATGTRQLLVDLIDPSEKVVRELDKIGLTTADIDVKTLGLIEVLRRLRDAGFQAYGTLETRAAAAFVAQSANIDNIEKLLASTQQQGVAEEAAATRVESLAAKWQIFLNTMAETASLIGTVVLPALEALVSTLTFLTKVINETLKFFGAIVTALMDVVGAGLEFAGVFEKSIDVNQRFKDSLEDNKLTVEEQAEIMDQLGGSVEDAETAYKDLQGSLESAKNEEESLSKETEKLLLRKKELTAETGALDSTIGQLSTRFPELRLELSDTENSFDNLVAAMVRLQDQALRTQEITAVAQADAAKLVAEQSQREINSIVSRNLDGRVGKTKVSRAIKGTEDFDRVVAEEQFNLLASNLRAGEINNFVRLMDSGTISPQVTRQFEDIRKQVVSPAAELARAEVNISRAQGAADRARFLGSDAGSDISRIAETATSQGDRFASQSAGINGESRQEIEAEIRKGLDLIQEQRELNKDNPAVRAALGLEESKLIAARNKLKPDEPKASRSSLSPAQRAAKKRDSLFERNKARIEKAEERELNQAFDNALGQISNSETLEGLSMLIGQTDEALDEWLEARTEAAAAQIRTQTGGENADSRLLEQRAKMLATAQREAEQQRIEGVRKIADAIGASLTRFIDIMATRINERFEQELAPLQQRVAVANARVSGFNNPIGSNNRAGFVSTILQRQADIAQVDLDKATIDGNAQRISELTALIGSSEATAAALDTQIKAGAGEDVQVQLQGVEERIIRLKGETRDLISTNAALEASYAVLSEAPTNFTDGARLAIQAVSIDLNAADNLGQELIKNLDQPIKSVGDSFRTFFNDVIMGTKSVGGAFKSMAVSIIQSLLDMVSAAIANQVFGSILKFAAGAFSPGSSSGVSSSSSGATSFGGRPGIFWHGGQIPRKMGGGPIEGGVKTRDSTLVRAANGEFIMRRAAVDSIGVGTLKAMNTQGAQALKGMGGQIIMGGGQPVETNVYVIQKDEQPQLGPNDVLAIISNDVLRGGVTKKLIKKVSNNG